MNEKEMRILDSNLRFFGYSLLELMENAGKGVAREINAKGKRIAIFCGLGNNGGDGLVAARYLANENSVSVFLLGSAREIKRRECKINWRRIKGSHAKVREIKGESELEEIQDNFDIIVDAVLGIGAKPPLSPLLSSAVRKMNKMRGRKISIDVPTPHFREDLNIALHCKKTGKRNEKVIGIGIPKELEKYVGAGDFLALTQPEPASHKGENGRLLIIGGSERYHGAPILATRAASHFVDIVYFSSVPENNELVKKMKFKIAEVIVIQRNEIPEFVKNVDCILIGPGMGISEETAEITNYVLRTRKKCVLDADSLKCADPKLLHKGCILTPHAGEFYALFGRKLGKDERRNAKIVERTAKKYGCTILKKGAVDIISDGTRTKLNFTHNVGMTKGGTGDVLAGLCGALFCKNEPFISACAAAFLNGYSANILAEKYGIYYTASQLASQLPKTAKLVQGYK